MKHKWCLSDFDPAGAPVTSYSWGGLGCAANVNTDGTHCWVNWALLSEMHFAVLAITKLKTIIKNILLKEETETSNIKYLIKAGLF